MTWRSVGQFSKVFVGLAFAPALIVVTLPQSVAGATGVQPHPSVEAANPALFKLSDMPKGWTSSPSASDNSRFPGGAQLAQCLGVPSTVVNANPPSVDSPDFSSKDTLLSVSDSVSTYSTVKAAQASYASLRNAKAPACLATVLNGTAKAQLQKSFGSGYKVGKVSVTRAPAGSFSARGVNIELSMPVTYQGTTLRVTFMIFDYVSGLRGQTVDFISVNSAFPPALTKQLSTLAVARL